MLAMLANPPLPGGFRGQRALERDDVILQVGVQGLVLDLGIWSSGGTMS